MRLTEMLERRKFKGVPNERIYVTKGRNVFHILIRDISES